MSDNNVIPFTTGTLDVEELLNDFLVDAEEYDTMVVVALRKDDTIDIGHATGGHLRKLGLLHLALSHFTDKIKYD